MALHQIDLRELARLGGAERAFVSLYLSGAGGLQSLDDREQRVLRLLESQPVEREHFEETMRMIREALDEHAVRGPMAFFASWAADFLVGYPLEVPPPDLLWVDRGPYLRPLAELQDEYEHFIVVSADADSTRVHVVAATVPREVERIKGEVKNQVKKGGWSQKRYQRRRENEMLHYAKEVAEVVGRIVEREGIERIVLLGAKQTLVEIREALPDRLQKLVVGDRAVDLSGEDADLFEVAQDVAIGQERAEEQDLWKRISGEAMSDGLAAFGPGPVLAAAREGRVEAMIVTRDATIKGMRCRSCELLAFAKPQQCPGCKSTDVFEVDLVNALVELLALSGASADFVDPIAGLTDAGDVAALLRY